MRALLLTDDDGFESSLPALDLFFGTGCSAPLTTPPDEADPDIALVDARTDLVAARTACRSLAASVPSTAVVAVVPAEDLATVGPDWFVDDVLLTTAGAVEVHGRIRLAIANRRRRVGDDTLRVGDLTVDPASYSASIADRELDLTITEFKLLNYLLQHAGQAFTRDILLREVWGSDRPGDRTVDVHVQRLRAKLGATYGSVVDTVRGVGYRAAVTPQDRAGPAGPRPRATVGYVDYCVSA